MNYLIIDRMIQDALIEDVPSEDITTNSIVDKNSKSTVDLICKEEGIIAGLGVFKRVFDILGGVDVELYKNDGDMVKNREKIAVLTGNTRNLLVGERVALNYLQRMSGIATITSKYVKKLEGTNTKLLDSRKTIPNLRILDKYSVKVGGGCNHRFNLSDGILLKDNHIGVAGGVKNAVELARKNTSFVRKIEVEVETLDMVKEAIEAKADIIMLDNMSLEMAKQAVDIINGRAIIEFSGNVNLETIESIGKIGVDVVSVGALTHSVKALDISMKNLKNI
ncbi:MULTISPECIES: carboxylating nicotinate-nucleotide diphosphorylase [unclassified Clostridioides]|uniref:carboxylating nicotinate-nucleotide diphosphorylase n=1 Tax=unclassified Clostridioides TaxID=2635829 RepID=UPI001D113BDB|nr:carboxylating nicotinate-nucleotide diphosphorylase [Clostridioides sp. ES-S-0171-01]MCC0688856.1 carboxylating nicotinate-nucleotide diphosphorylase [Clostridioides sp. ES-S-0056-01]MCC0716104.1 carboxylating nicotinate-nucleotide diphosphorylase [Clostridioides sp. ES-S-0077-01]UDN53521.1 carboxylating nicotinate-nucleotide diphosphorylase [Clostridioides sp. ES-S-0054-01]